MVYDFDEIVDRTNTGANKWEALVHKFQAPDAIPLWVADMDFKAPPEVIDVMVDRVKHGIFGYTERPASFFESIQTWFHSRQKWDIQKEWIEHCYGVVPALRLLVETFTDPGDAVVIQPPVYHPFRMVVENQDRQLVNNPLRFDGTQYTMDYEDLEKKLVGAKMLILCSPHNPVGRVWTQDELVRLGELCVKHGVLVISDEIHGDLVYPSHCQMPFASISEAFAMNSITCVAPSKTFNLAGLNTANVIIPNEDLRARYRQAAQKYMVGGANPMGMVALEAAYRYGGAWLDALLEYLQENVNLVRRRLEPYGTEVRLIEPQGTYLLWLDCRGLGMDPTALNTFMLKEAKLALNEGPMFGPGGEGFQRMNIACPRATVEQAMDQLEQALQRRA